MQYENRAQRGFTLIELMIVIAVISILASITVPSLVSRRAATNESAVVATLRSISQAEYQFRTQGLVDANQDSGFEYGTLREMTGQDLLRGSTVVISNSLLSASLGSLDSSGQLRRHGYIFQLYLPNAAGEGVSATASNSASFDADLAKDYWTCLAWPIDAGQSGRLTYFINHQGQIVKTKDIVYSGTVTVPEAGAALLGSTPKKIDSSELATKVLAADGNAWIPVN